MAKQLVDKLDKKILYHLDVDARQPYSNIAKKVGLSTDAVQYRVERMRKEGVIRGFYTLLDPSALGYMSCRFFLQFRLTTPLIEKEIVDYFVSHPRYWWVCGIDGFRDLGVAAWLEDVGQFAALKADLHRKFHPHLRIQQESIYSAFYLYRRAYLLGADTDGGELTMLCQARPERLDDTDWKILGAIGADARLSSPEIAKRTGTTPATVLNRIGKMKQAGVIRRFRPIIDLGKLGYYWYKLELSLQDYSIKKKILDFCHRHPNIIYAYETVGGADLEIEMEVESYERFRSVLERIKEEFGSGIENYRHLLWYREHKITYVPHRGH